MTRPDLLPCQSDLAEGVLASLLARYGLYLCQVTCSGPIPGSFWGDDEAGLIGARVHVRSDTPLHSILHESCHYICMTSDRREGLDTDAGGNYDEENAVCYLQLLLADQLTGYSAARCMMDMDAWGYSFRLGSARQWFEEDADQARDDLQGWGVIDVHQRPTGMIRDC